MGDMGEQFNELRESKRAIRAKFGIPCPECIRLLPKANPSILLPQQRCKIHNYRDPRKRTDETDYFIHAGYKKGE